VLTLAAPGQAAGPVGRGVDAAAAFDRLKALAGEWQSEFLDATNLPDPRAGHMRSVRLRLVDGTHLATEWQFYENGQRTFNETATYTRVR
jgi:hypothetical protein